MTMSSRAVIADIFASGPAAELLEFGDGEVDDRSIELFSCKEPSSVLIVLGHLTHRLGKELGCEQSLDALLRSR